MHRWEQGKIIGKEGSTGSKRAGEMKLGLVQKIQSDFDDARFTQKRPSHLSSG